MKTTYLRINPADNVAVAISPLHAGETIEADGRVITLRTDVPAGHKVTLKNFQAGENIIKYGYPIGHVTVDVPEGTWVSEKEIKTNLAGLLDYTYQPVEVHTDILVEHRTFKGYRRRNGDVGVRNEIWIIPTVGCVNGIVNQLAEATGEEPLRQALSLSIHRNALTDALAARTHLSAQGLVPTAVRNTAGE